MTGWGHPGGAEGDPAGGLPSLGTEGLKGPPSFGVFMGGGREGKEGEGWKGSSCGEQLGRGGE